MQINTPQQFVDALFAGTLANCDVNAPIHLWDHNSPEFKLVNNRLKNDLAGMKKYFPDTASWEAWVETSPPRSCRGRTCTARASPNSSPRT